MSTHLPDDLLTGVVDATLAPGDRDAVEAHLRTCARCRGEVEAAARGRAALAALPAEVAPPIDVLAAVAAAAEATAAGATSPARRVATARHPAAAPRWYRSAGLVAAAAAIALAVMIVPDLTRQDVSSDSTAAVGDASQEAGLSAAGQEDQGPYPAPTLELVSTDFDHGSLAALGQAARQGAPSPSAAGQTSIPTVAAPPPGGGALACVRAGAAGGIAPGERVDRLLAATFERTPSYIGVLVRGPAAAPVDVRVVAVATDGCRLLDSA